MKIKVKDTYKLLITAEDAGEAVFLESLLKGEIWEHLDEAFSYDIESFKKEEERDEA